MMLRWSGVFLVALCLSGCGPSEQEVRDEIFAASTCTASSDCVSAGAMCPFGCSIWVNQAQVERIRRLLADFDRSQEHCMYRCGEPAAPLCAAGRCVSQY
jgi:hypothetical protein